MHLDFESDPHGMKGEPLQFLGGWSFLLFLTWVLQYHISIGGASSENL